MQPKWGQDVESIEEILINQLSEKFGAKPELTDSLIFLGIDSVGMAELTFDIEQRFKISVDDTLLNVETVQDLADYIRERLKP
jgi:acyl carrier protein